MIPFIIQPQQGAFTQGRSALNNALVVLEVIHSILTRDRRLNNGKPCIAIKLDLCKAYKKLKWSFILHTLQHLGFPEHFINLVMSCISTSLLSLRFNGMSSTYFKPSRGFR